MRLPTFSLAIAKGVLLLAAVSAPGVAAAGTDTVARIKETGEIRLAVRRNAAPLASMEGETATGYSVEVCLEAAKRMSRAWGQEGLKPVLVPVGPSDRFEAVAEGRADLLCGAASVTMARREAVDFSIATFVDGASVLAPAGFSGDFRDLAGGRVGVVEGTTTERALRNTLSRMDMTADVVTAPSHEAGLEALLEGRIDAWFGDQSILHVLRGDPRAAGRIAMAQELLTVETHALALPRGDSDFRLAVDRALASMFADGTMRGIFARSLPGATPGAALGALHLLAIAPE